MSEEIKNEAMEIVGDDGSVTVPIKSDSGELIGEFRFRPTDFNIVKRYNEVSQKFADVVKPLIDADIDANGEGTDEESMRLLDEAEREDARFFSRWREVLLRECAECCRQFYFPKV